jgi:hypothetical protein
MRRPLFDVPLRKGARRKMHPPSMPAQARNRRIVQADAQRMTHELTVVRRATSSISMCSSTVGAQEGSAIAARTAASLLVSEVD